MPLVSIIMNCHNGARYLPEALDSVYQQTFKDYEIIFWDNKSTDNSGEIAQSYGEPLRYFRGEEFLPLGAARNAAIEKVMGKYIAFLDCDDIWLPEKLEKQVELLDSNKELGLVYSDSYVIDGDGKLREGTLFSYVKPVRGKAFNELFQRNPIPLVTAIITKEALNKVGKLNPKYEIAEEYDLWLRIAEYHLIDFIEQPLAKYRLHSESVFRKNTIRHCQELLQIIDYWLKKKPHLKKELGSKIRRKKVGLYYAMVSTAIRQVFKNRNMKSIKESGNLLKYLMLPKQ
jgi:glycosyltransferase involved in cell wall biosynthesis